MTLNRAQRRSLKRNLKRHVGELAHPIPGSVVLRGGPMDGWIVKPDAPALEADWREHWLEAQAEGEYLKWADAQRPKVTAMWDQLGDRERRPFREAVRIMHGAGRYVLRRDRREAAWRAEARATGRVRRRGGTGTRSRSATQGRTAASSPRRKARRWLPR